MADLQQARKGRARRTDALRRWLQTQGVQCETALREATLFCSTVEELAWASPEDLTWLTEAWDPSDRATLLRAKDEAQSQAGAELTYAELNARANRVAHRMDRAKALLEGSRAHHRRTHHLGTGFDVPPVGIGTWQVFHHQLHALHPPRVRLRVGAVQQLLV